MMSDTMERARLLVTFLGNVMGPNCEVVLQDVASCRIVAIANGEVSGRHVDAPLTDLALKMIADKHWENNDYELNYSGVTSDGRILRSSTFFIKEQGKLLGMLCINVDTSCYEALSREILNLGGLTSLLSGSSTTSGNTTSGSTASTAASDYLQKAAPVEKFSESVTDTIAATISQCLTDKGNIPVSRLTQNEKLEIVQILNEQGVFLLKGAISDVAAHLKCSDASIYRYLSKLK